MTMYLKRRCKAFYEQFIRLPGNPRDIAFSMAIGIFVGVTPTIPFHTLLIIAITYVLKRNFTAAYMGSWLISNPITIPFFYVAQFQIGRTLMGREYCEVLVPDYSFWSFMELGWNGFCVPLLLGGIVTAPVLAIPAYYATLRAAQIIREKRSDNTERDTSKT